jgi:hypothetical protein
MPQLASGRLLFLDSSHESEKSLALELCPSRFDFGCSRIGFAAHKNNSNNFCVAIIVVGVRNLFS